MGPNEVATAIARLTELMEWVQDNTAVAAMVLTALAMVLAIQSAVYAHQSARASIEAARDAADANRRMQQWRPYE